MKRKNHFTGSVFQFFVPEIKKYAFCKFFDFTHLSEIHGLLAQVFNCFSDNENNSIDDLKYVDWLFGVRSMHKWPNLRADTGWKSLGILSSSDDEVVPDFKSVQAAPYIVEDESKIGPWFPVHNLTERGPNCEYEDVRHLEHKVLTVSSLDFVWRTGMEYCRNNGLPIIDYYDIKNSTLKKVYWQMINVPIYREIPKKIRGRALGGISK
jgi:hypothetical protein